MLAHTSAHPSLVEQATAILQAAQDLQHRLDEANLPQPSTHPNSRKDWHDCYAYSDILRARSALVDATHALYRQALGPNDHLTHLAGVGTLQNEVLLALDTLGVADVIPSDSKGVAVDELAARLGVEPGLLARYLRFACILGVFCEPEPGVFAHTAASVRTLRDLAPFFRMRVLPVFHSGAVKVPEAMRAAATPSKGTKGMSKPAVQRADPSGRDMWTILEQDCRPPGEGMRIFAAGMKSSLVGVLGAELSPYVHGFDWPSIGGGTVVDVGGSSGHVELTILPRLPKNVSFVVQDLPSNEEPARVLLGQHPEAQERLVFQVHDFFNPQPALPAGYGPPKIYLLSRVLHDWQDSECITILQHLIPSMEKNGTRIWVMEQVLSESGSEQGGRVPCHVDMHTRGTDLLMFNLYGGGERTLDDWRALFVRADARLRIIKVEAPLNLGFAFMEVVLDVWSLT